MSKNKDTRQFSDDEYAVIVLQCLKRAARRSHWITEMVLPRLIAENDTADSRDIVDALEHAIEAVKERKREERE